MVGSQLEEFRRSLLAINEEIAAALSAGAESAKPVDLGEPIGRLSRLDAMQQ